MPGHRDRSDGAIDPRARTQPTRPAEGGTRAFPTCQRCDHAALEKLAGGNQEAAGTYFGQSPTLASARSGPRPRRLPRPPTHVKPLENLVSPLAAIRKRAVEAALFGVGLAERSPGEAFRQALQSPSRLLTRRLGISWHR